MLKGRGRKGRGRMERKTITAASKNDNSPARFKQSPMPNTTMAEKPNSAAAVNLTVDAANPSAITKQIENVSGKNDEKSSYEIAAEALCLMKTSGATAATCRKYVTTDSETCLTSVSKSSAAADNLSANDSQNSATEVQVSLGCSVLTSGNIDLTRTNKQPTRYFLVPENALVTSDRSVSALPIQGTPYFIVMSGQGLPPSSVISFPPVSVSSFPQGAVFQETDIGQLTYVSQEVEIIDDSSECIDSTVATAKKNTAKKHDALKFPPCVICDGEASGMHYGSNTCEACKNFFRRCLLRKSAPPFVCHGANNCEISYKKNKNNCSACRLAKCLTFGMSKEKCKMGRYTALMRTETIKKVRILEGKDEEDENTSSGEPASGTVSVSEVSQHPVSSETQTGDSSTGSVTVAASASEPASNPSAAPGQEDRDIYGAIISKQICSSDNDVARAPRIVEYDEDLIQTLVNAMENIKPWGDELNSEESRKEVVIKHFEAYHAKVATFGKMSDVSRNEYWTLLKKYGIDIDSQWAMFKAWSKDWEFIIARYCKFAKNIPNFRTLSYDDQACLLKATHSAFFMILMHRGYYPEFSTFLELNGTPYHVEEASDKFFSGDFVKSMVDMMFRLQKLDLTKTEMALLMAIVTMSPDQCKVEGHIIVEKTQLELTDLLLRHMSKMYGHAVAMKKFTSFIDNLTKMREVSNVYYKEYREICSVSMVKETVPNVDCILPDDE